MADFGFTPELVASGTIRPFRIVTLSGAFTGAESAAATDKKVVGVADGSVRRFDATANAIAGDPISLQPSMTVQVEAGAAVAAGALLTSNANGQAVTASSTNIAFYMALEAASAAGEIIRAYRVGPVVA